MTLEAWVNPAVVTSAWRDVIYKGNDNYYLEGTSDNAARPAGGGIFGGAERRRRTAPARSRRTSGRTSPLTYDGATLRLYVNGTLVGSQAKTGAITTSTNPLQIGGDSIYGQYFNGLIDEVRIYNIPLAAADIQSDMTTPLGSGGGGDSQPPRRPAPSPRPPPARAGIDLSWGAATDNVGVTGYRVDRCQGAGCTDFSHLVQTPAAGDDVQRHAGSRRDDLQYQVRAMDAAGNLGPASNARDRHDADRRRRRASSPRTRSTRGRARPSPTRSGNGNTGTLANATWTSAGQVRRTRSRSTARTRASTSPTRRRSTSPPA